jgi:hypothetical protein
VLPAIGKQGPPEGNSNAVKNKDRNTVFDINRTDNSHETASSKLARLKRDDPALAERAGKESRGAAVPRLFYGVRERKTGRCGPVMVFAIRD